MSKITLTPVERMILLNQYQIMKALKIGTDHDNDFLIKILEDGYETHFDKIITTTDNFTSKETSDEVHDILTMFRVIGYAVAKLPASEQKKYDDLTFKGFDLNNETDHFTYTEFLIEDNGSYKEFKGMYLNSHTLSTLPKYRAMVEVWKRINERSLTPELTESDLDELIKPV